MDILYNFIPLSVYRLPQTDDCSRVYQCVNFPLHLAACICSYTASISHSLFGCPCTFHHGPTPWTRKTLRTDSSKWGKISAGSMHRSRWSGGKGVQIPLQIQISLNLHHMITKKMSQTLPPWKTEITIRILQYLEKKLITLADEHACYISLKLGFKQYKLYNNLSC